MTADSYVFVIICIQHLIQGVNVPLLHLPLPETVNERYLQPFGVGKSPDCIHGSFVRASQNRIAVSSIIGGCMTHKIYDDHLFPPARETS